MHHHGHLVTSKISIQPLLTLPFTWGQADFIPPSRGTVIWSKPVKQDDQESRADSEMKKHGHRHLVWTGPGVDRGPGTTAAVWGKPGLRAWKHQGGQAGQESGESRAVKSGSPLHHGFWIKCHLKTALLSALDSYITDTSPLLSEPELVSLLLSKIPP